MKFFLAHKHETKLEVAYSSDDSKKFLDKLTGSNYDDSKAFTTMLENIDFENAGCSNPSDKITIDDKVRNDGGYEKLETNVRDALRKWMITYLDDRVVHSRIDMWKLLLVQAGVLLKINNDRQNEVIAMCETMLKDHDNNIKYDKLRGDTFDKLGQCYNELVYKTTDYKTKIELIEKSLKAHKTSLDIRKKVGTDQEAAKAGTAKAATAENDADVGKWNGHAIADAEGQIGAAYIKLSGVCKGEVERTCYLDEALKYYKRALKTSENWNKCCQEPGNYSDFGLYYCQIGIVFHRMNDLKRAREYMEMDLKFICASPKMGKQSRLCVAYHNTGTVLSNIGNSPDDPALLNQAIHYLNKALSTKMSLFGRMHIELIKTYCRLAQAYARNGDNDNAYNNFCQCLQVCQHNNAFNEYFDEAEAGKTECGRLSGRSTSVTTGN